MNAKVLPTPSTRAIRTITNGVSLRTSLMRAPKPVPACKLLALESALDEQRTPVRYKEKHPVKTVLDQGELKSVVVPKAP